MPRYRDEQGRFTKDSGARYEVTVWEVAYGDVIEVSWDATEEDVAEIEAKYEGDPMYAVQIVQTSEAREEPQ